VERTRLQSWQARGRVPTNRNPLTGVTCRLRPALTGVSRRLRLPLLFTRAAAGDGAGLRTVGLCMLAILSAGAAAAQPAIPPPRLAAIAAPAVQSAPQLEVIPAPAHVEAGRGSFTLRSEATLSHPRDAQAAQIAAYFAHLMLQTRGLRLHLSERAGQATAGEAIIFRLDPSLSMDDSEGYEIDVSASRIMLSARDSRGLFYAAVTLWELCTPGPARGDDEIVLPAMRITDSPRFRWRGLMLDSARHFQSPEFIMRLIDWMALHKLNVLQWHLTDDQAWRLQIRKYPLLTSVGAWRLPAGPAAATDIDPGTGKPRLYGGYYTQEMVREIVAHAAERYVTIVPEIDVPGHATAAIVAYPWLGVTDAPPSAVPSDWGIYDNLLSPQPATFEFLQNVLDEVIALFPGEYVHVGGDEAVTDQWKGSPRVQARMRQLGIRNETALQGYFTRWMQQYLQSHGRRLIGGDEILQGGIGADAAVVSWRATAGALTGAASGHDTVLSPSPTLYFDNAQGSRREEPPGRETLVRLEDVYRFDPMPAAIQPQQRSHVLGVQANIWTEHIRTAERVQEMTFPRAAAVAEVGWSSPEHIDWHSFVQRLPRELDRYRAVGLEYSTDVFAVNVQAVLDRERESVHLSLENQAGFGEIHYTLDGSDPGPAAPLYIHPIDVPARGELRAGVFKGRESLADIVSRGLDIHALERRTSHQLEPCTPKLLLSLEDDAPVNSGEPRAVFSIDILNPCWKFTGVDLTHVTGVRAAVGQVPFNFQIGAQRQTIRLNPPHTPAGELEVRVDSCDGPPVAVLSLEPAVGNNAVTTLPSTTLQARPGRHDLCFEFAQHQLDPMWAIDWVQLLE
jgi:hexosaminidase